MNDTRPSSIAPPLPAGRHFPPAPDGWFAVARPAQLAPGGVLAFQAFDRELVLYRTEAGEAVVVDAHCPHLGAHLGHGGSVVGDRLRCPFHGWEFDRDGVCQHIPYATRIPRGAGIGRWQTHETPAFVYVWHHALGDGPEWSPPELPQYADPEWRRLPSGAFDLEYATHIQDITENLVDLAHFRTIHGVASTEDVRCQPDGWTLDISYEMEVASGRALPGMPTVTSRSGTRFHGVGTAVTTITVPKLIDFVIHASARPIATEPRVSAMVDFFWRPLSVAGRVVGPIAAKRMLAEAMQGAVDDRRIWEHKIYQARPLLCEDERPIGIFRKWARRFYSESDPS